MAPKRTNKTQSRRSNTLDSSEAESQDADTTHSQEQEQAVHTLQEAFKAKNLEAKKRHRECEKANEASHRNRVKEWQDRARQIMTEHEATIRAIERPKIQRLINLRRRRRELQREMNKQVLAMDKVYQSTMQRVSIVLQQRLSDLAAPTSLPAGGVDGKGAEK